ncbi:MAG: hypothetical protein ACYTFV_05695 [Planctomycetota bacterium]|jgi:hypothetical protein
MSLSHPQPPFVEAAREVLGEVRGAYAGLLTALGSPRRPADVQTSLGLDKKLAWRVRRVADALDPLEGASFVPSATSAQRVAKAALAQGVERQVVDGVLEATQVFERFVSERADDRASFEAMAAAVSGGLDPILLEARRAAFRANVLIQGKRSEAMLFAFAMAPGERPDQLRALSLRGHVELQRLRPDASVALSKHRFESGDQPAGTRRPLDPEAAQACSAPVVRALCSDDLPELVHTTEDSGFRLTHLAHADLGSDGALTYVLGDLNDEFPNDPVAFGSLCEVSTPSRRLVHDFLIHEDLDLDAPQLRIVGNRHEAEQWPANPGPLDADARVLELGQGLTHADFPEWSGAHEPLAYAFDKAGWDVSKLRHFRVVIEYPVQGSIAWLRAARAGAPRD